MAISNKNAVQGIVHGLSNTGSTVYIEPQQVIDLNNRLRLAQGELKAEEQRIRRYSLYLLSSLCWYKSENPDVISAATAVCCLKSSVRKLGRCV